MATTGKIRSNAINVYVSSVVGDTIDTDGTDDTYDIIASSTSGTFSGELETLDATTKDNDGARSILVSAINWSVSCEGLVHFGDESNKLRPTELFDIWNNKSKVRVAWSTGVEGDTFYYGNGFITSYEESAGLNEIASFSITIEGDGGIEKATIDTGATFNNTQYVS
jgi:TP901-1 family phage major tail protein